MNMFLEVLGNFFDHPIFAIVGGFSLLFSFVIVLLHVVFWVLGITKLLWRLGYGRWVRKIAIVANRQAYEDLKGDLVDSGIFRNSNIINIHSRILAKVKDFDLLLVDYQSFNEEQIANILENKKSKSGMVFYFPQFSVPQGVQISPEMFKKIGNTQNTTIVNMRGRLLNDIVTTLITTSYEKR